VSYAQRLIHTLSVVRQIETGDLDDYGQPVTTPISTSVSGLPQPKRIREVAAIHEAGATIGTWTIFLAIADVTAGDAITHLDATCAVPDSVDLGDHQWNVTGIRNAAGIGHHLEVDASLVEGAVVEAVAS